LRSSGPRRPRRKLKRSRDPADLPGTPRRRPHLLSRRLHLRVCEEIRVKKIFVGNFPFSFTEDQLRQLFAPFGTVDSASVVTDRDTGRSRGFGFVEMANDNEAAAAITALNGKDSDGRALTVNEARPKTERGGGGGGGRGGYGRDRGDRGGGGGRGPRW